MATAKWATPSAQGSNIASTTLDSLADSATSVFVTHDNSSNLDYQGSVLVNLGSITTVAGASLTLRTFSCQGSDAPDNTGSVGGGDQYNEPLLVGTGAKVVVFRMVRFYPESMRFCFTNSAGVALAASGNSVKVRPYDEAIS